MYEPVVPGRNPQRRLPDASSWLSATLALPAFLGSLVVMALIGGLVLPSASWVVPVLWILSGAVLFVPAVESVMARMSFNVSRPSQAELAVLVPAWQAVCDAAGVDGSKYHLLVEESDQPNAMAAAGRTVAVSRAALRLPPAELAAVLAHELGHHLSAHAVVSWLAWWYALPSRGAAFLGGVAIRVVLAVGRVFLVFGNGLGYLAALFLAIIMLTAIAFVSFWLLLAPLISPLLAWVSRLGEYHADRTAAQLGYGPALIQAFRRWQYAEASDRHADGLKARLLSTHPSLSDRIRRLEKIPTAW
jgi:Zn-dependent protease with chaperone function